MIAIQNISEKWKTEIQTIARRTNLLSLCGIATVILFITSFLLFTRRHYCASKKINILKAAKEHRYQRGSHLRNAVKIM